MKSPQMLALTLAVLALAGGSGAWCQAVGSAATDGVSCSTIWVVDACLACWPSFSVCKPCTCRAAFTLVSQCSPLPAAAALLELKRAATNAKFSSWVGSAPCGAKPWQYITCTQGRVVAL